MTIASDPASDFTATSTGESPFALWRFYLLRAGYLLTAGGMGLQMWSICGSRLSRESTRDRSSHPLLRGSRAAQGLVQAGRKRAYLQRHRHDPKRDADQKCPGLRTQMTHTRKNNPAQN
jgi:hypothetical protein